MHTLVELTDILIEGTVVSEHAYHEKSISSGPTGNVSVEATICKHLIENSHTGDIPSTERNRSG